VSPLITVITRSNVFSSVRDKRSWTNLDNKHPPIPVKEIKDARLSGLAGIFLSWSKKRIRADAAVLFYCLTVFRCLIGSMESWKLQLNYFAALAQAIY
jgi:hypothetical protein